MPASHEPYRIRSPETWEKARLAYLDGEPAEAVCDRFDLGLSAFRKRARDGGWRRVDQGDPPDNVLEEDANLEAGELGDLIPLAWARLVRAMARGRAADAVRWLRLHSELVALQSAMSSVGDEAEPVPAPAARPAGPPEPQTISDEVHDVHAVSAPAPLNRAERRRLARLGHAGSPPP